jgi:hypothetical protein
MKVDRNETLAGFPLIKIRDLLRPFRPGTISSEDIERELGLPNAQAEAVLQAMADAGFLEPTSEAPGGSNPHFAITTLGSRLCVTRFIKRITRAKADALVSQMLARVTEINQRDELVFRVKRVRAFGSLCC